MRLVTLFVCQPQIHPTRSLLDIKQEFRVKLRFNGVQGKVRCSIQALLLEDNSSFNSIIPMAGKAKLSAQSSAHKYTRFQLPVLPSHARTGHSIQGYTAKWGVVVDIGSQFFAGDYIAISRAMCME